MSSARRRIKRTVPVAKKPVSASPVASRLHSKWRAGSVALLLLAVFALAWKFTPAPSASASTSSASAAPVALASLSDAPVETALLTPPLPLITPTNAPVPDAVKNALPASVPAQLGEPGAKLRRVVDKKIANGMVTLTLKDEQTGQLSTMTQPLGTNVSTVEAGGEEKVVASAPVVKPPDPVKDDFPTTGIEKVQAGMTVPTRNPITGKTEFKKVVRIFKHTVYEIVKLELTDGSPGKVVDSLRGTPQHPFFTPSGMVAMGELKPEMKVITRRGPPLVVKSVTREPHPQGIPVYNFEVEGDHTYFVGKAQGGTWVHNDCTPTSLFHYTTEEGMNGIVESGKLNPSLKALNPADARYGNGQYLSDILPGTKTPAQLSRAFINNPFPGQRFTHFVEIDVTGLPVVQGRSGVFLVPGETPLDLTGRILRSGPVR